MIRTLLACLLLLFFTSCSTIILAVIGGHPPRIVTNEYIYSYGKINGIDSVQLIVKSDEFLIKNPIGEANKLLLFDENGYYIDVFTNSEDPNCKANVLNLIKVVGPQTYFPRDSSQTLFKESSNWQILSTKENYDLKNKLHSNYTIVYYWNTFLGKYRNQDYIKIIKESISENKSIIIDLILVNQDLREGIGLEKGKRHN